MDDCSASTGGIDARHGKFGSVGQWTLGVIQSDVENILKIPKNMSLLMQRVLRLQRVARRFEVYFWISKSYSNLVNLIRRPTIAAVATYETQAS